MLYHYLAVDTEGRLTEDDFEAESVPALLRVLGGKNLKPVSVSPVRPASVVAGWFQGKITIADKVFLTRYLALMLRVGTDLIAAIDILIADFEKPAVKNLLIEIRENVSKGLPFYRAFADRPKDFSPVFVNLVRAAEAAGNLQKTFDDLSASLEGEAELRSRVRAAFIYPIILLIAAVLVSGFLAVFAIPRIASVFRDAGITPPGFSRVVFAAGLFLNAHFFTIALVLAVVLGTGWYFFFHTLLGRRLRDRAFFSAPLIRRVYHDLAVQRFSATLSALLRAGLPIIDSVKITAAVVGSVGFENALLRIADEGLAKGVTIGEAFRREPVFPRVVTNLIAISERAGHLEESLETLGTFYVSSVDANVRTLVSFLEPVLLLLMGLMVATIALAIIIPIYQLSSTF